MGGGNFFEARTTNVAVVKKEKNLSNFNKPVVSSAANNGEEKVVGTNPFEDDYDDTDGEKEVS